VHLKRLKTLVPTWVSQERTMSKKPLSTRELVLRMHRRVINEFGLMSLEPTALTKAWLSAAQQPGFCKMIGLPSIVHRMTLLQKLPRSERAAALEDERMLLARWGSVRSGLPPRPEVSVLAQTQAMIGRIKSGGPRPVAAMVPQQAHLLLGRNEEASDNWFQRCQTAQWWLRQQPLKDEAERDRVLADFRYATLILASDMVTKSKQKPMALINGYPQVAAVFGVEGVLTLDIKIDGEGRVVGVDVIKRDIHVPGVHGNPPVSFDTLLDEAALTRARAVRHAKPDPKMMENDVLLARQEFSFALDQDRDDASNGAAQ